MHRAAAQIVVEEPWGIACLSPEIGTCHARNFVWARGDGGGLGAGELIATGERILGGAGLTHRLVAVDEPRGGELIEAFAARGYGCARHIYLAHDATARGGPADADVVEIDPGALARAYDGYLATDPATPYGRDATVRADLCEHQRAFGARSGVDEHCFAVLEAGEPVAWAKLWLRDGVAQVEDVICLAEHRGRGFGRAVVQAATLAGLAAQPELLFIVADADEWPKELYRRMGYSDLVGTLRIFKPVAQD